MDREADRGRDLPALQGGDGGRLAEVGGQEPRPQVCRRGDRLPDRLRP